MKRSDIWFSDGSVVLQAEDVQFRVHKTFLARHSTVFADLFGIPHPDSEPQVEGCPVVILHDTAEDIKHMLIGLYDKSYDDLEVSIPFDAAAGMLRTGRKYDIETLKTQALSRLKEMIPSRLSDAAPRIYAMTLHDDHPDSLLVKIVDLAIDCDVQTILPLGLYMCIAQDEHLTIPGLRRSDIKKDLHREYEMQVKLFLAKEELIEAYAELFGWVDDLGLAESCKNKELCGRVRQNLVVDLWRPQPTLRFMLADWKSLFDSIYEIRMGSHEPGSHPEADLCRSCLRGAEDAFERRKSQIWDKLPSIFGLPAWEELRDL